MSTLPATRVPEQSKPPRCPPRPPQAWSYSAADRELTIVDCDGKKATYAVEVYRSDCGTNYVLTSVDSRFGECRTVHIGDAAADCACDCPGGCYAGICKHVYCVAAAIVEGKLPFIEPTPRVVVPAPMLSLREPTPEPIPAVVRPARLVQQSLCSRCRRIGAPACPRCRRGGAA